MEKAKEKVAPTLFLGGFSPISPLLLYIYNTRYILRRMKPETPKPGQPDSLARLLATIEDRRTQHEAAQAAARREREDAKLEALRHRGVRLWWEHI